MSMMKMVLPILALIIIIMCSIVTPSDADALQDFCVADLSSPYHVNGFACLDPSQVTADHFFTSRFDLPGSFRNVYGSTANIVTATRVPGLNTLGISMHRIDVPPGSLILPHHHARSSEILTVIQGTLEVGFVTSDPERKLISKVLNKGDVFVFPIGLIHYQSNINGEEPVVAIFALNTQNVDFIISADAVFGSKPPIPTDVLAKAFQIDNNLARSLQSNFSAINE